MATGCYNSSTLYALQNTYRSLNLLSYFYNIHLQVIDPYKSYQLHRHHNGEFMCFFFFSNNDRCNNDMTRAYIYIIKEVGRGWSWSTLQEESRLF